MPVTRTSARPTRSLPFAVAVGALLLAVSCVHNLPRPATPPPPAASAIKPRAFKITAYCLSGRTASGTKVARGIVAADPRVLPLGSVISVTGLDRRYDGTYTVMDTGARIRGHKLDLYLPDCAEAVRFGRRSARVSSVQ